MALRRNKKNPDERGFSRNDQKKMLAADTPFVIKEAYNTIRTSLLFTQKGESCPVFVVTSPDANNGKPSTPLTWRSALPKWASAP